MTKEWWEDYAIKILRTGSRVICDPPVTNTDRDYLILLSTFSAFKLEEVLREKGFTIGGSNFIKVRNIKDLVEWPSYERLEEYLINGEVFHSWKKDDLNLILTASEDYFEEFAQATMLATKLNLRHKVDRITLFEAITRNQWPYYSDLMIKE